MRAFQNMGLLALLGAASNAQLIDDAVAAGELVPSPDGPEGAYCTPEGSPDILVCQVTLQNEVDPTKEVVLTFDTVGSERFNGGFAIIKAVAEGQPIPLPLPLDVWAAIRPDIKASWQAVRDGRKPEGLVDDAEGGVPQSVADQAGSEASDPYPSDDERVKALEAILSTRNPGSKDADALQAAIGAVRLLTTMERLPETVELSMAKHIGLGMSAIANGLDPDRAVDLGSRTQHLLDAVVKPKDASKPLLLSPAQRALLSRVLLVGLRA